MATIGVVEGRLVLRDEFTKVLTGASASLDDAGKRMNTAGSQAAQLGNRINGIGSELRDVSDKTVAASVSFDGVSSAMEESRSSANSLGGELATLGSLAVVAHTVFGELRDSLREASKEAAKISPVFAEASDSVQSFFNDLRGVILIGPLDLFRQSLRKTADELQRLAALRSAQQFGAKLDLLDRIAVRLAESLGLLPDKIREAVTLFDRFELPEAFTLEGRRQINIDRFVPPELPRILEDTATAFDAAGDAAEPFADALQDVIDRALPLEKQIRDLTADQDLLSVAMRGSGEQAEAAARAYQANAEELLKLGGAATGTAEALDLVVKSSSGISEIADEVSKLPTATGLPREEDLRGARTQLQGMYESVAAGFGDALSAAIRGDGEAAVAALGNALQSVLSQVIDNAISRIAQQLAQQQVGGAAGAGGAGTGAVTGAAAGAVAGLFVGVIVDKLAQMLSDDVTFKDVNFAIDQFGISLSGALGAAIAEGIPEAVGEFVDITLADLSKDEKIIFDAFRQLFANLFSELGVVLPESFQPFFFNITQKWEDGQLIATRVIIDGITKSFETIEEAIGFAMQRFLQSAVDQGVVFDEAVKQLIQGFQGDPSQFQDALSRVQGLADAALMSLDGLSAIEIEMRKLPATLNALRGELVSLGLSADQVTRLVGGQLVASFAAWRQQITGEELSVEQRQAIAQAQLELFNAQMDLELARLEAEKQALLADAGLTAAQIGLINASLSAQSAGLTAEGKLLQTEGKLVQAEVGLHGNVIDARGKFVQAEGKLFSAEAQVMAGFVQAGAGIVQAGIGVISTFGDVLALLPEEIRLQVVAIQKVIDALKKIGKIKIGDIRIPGIPDLPGPRPPGPGGPGPGGPGPTPADPFAGLQGLLDRLFPLRASLRDLQADARLLTAAFNKGKISEDDYRRGLEKINDEMKRLRTQDIVDRIRGTLDKLLQLADAQRALIEELRNAFEGLARFREELLIGPQTILSPGRQLAETERQFREAVARAQAGDISAIADVQRLGQRLLELGGQFFGTSGAGFGRLFRLVQDLTGDLLEDGNELIEDELEKLDEINNQIADLLETQKDILGLTQEEIDAIRDGAKDNTDGLRNIREELENNRRDLTGELGNLRRDIINLGKILARMAA